MSTKAPRQNVVRSLHQTQMLDSERAALPAGRLASTVTSNTEHFVEILSSIIDALPVPDLMRFARVSKRYNEMVYDDTRWVQRLQRMGCWNEAEARTQAGGAPDNPELDSILSVLSRVRSIRGQARQEYGKVYGALSPYYLDISKVENFREPEQQAQLLSQLLRFAKSDTILEATREGRLTAVITLFESAALREFEQ